MFLHSPAIAQYDNNFAVDDPTLRTVSENNGATNIKLSYHRVNAAGLEIFGGIIPYDQVWTTGDDTPTSIYFSSDVEINNVVIVEGTYALYNIAKSNGDWTVIINTEELDDPAEYNDDMDVIRFDITPSYVDRIDRLIYDVERETLGNSVVSITWGNDRIEFDVSISVDDFIDDDLQQNLLSAQSHNEWVFYLQAAETMLETSGDLDQARTWIDLSETLSTVDMEWQASKYTYDYVLGHMLWVKAKILSAQGMATQASNYAVMAKTLTQNSYYTQNNELEQIDYWIVQWSAS